MKPPIPIRRALAWSALWVGLSAITGGILAVTRGAGAAAEFFTAYVLEKSLSVDNLCVFLLIFQHFDVSPHARQRVLTWGVIGAVVLRAVMVLGGLELMRHVHAIIYVFGAILVLTGIRTFQQKDAEDDRLEQRRDVRLLRRILPLTTTRHGEQFFARENGRRVVTMLFLALVVIELSDVMFAIDSIPAVLSVSQDALIVYSSNLLAILGLRSLFFAIQGGLERLRHLQAGLGVLLVAVGAKMILSHWVHVPAWSSLLGVVVILGMTTLLSLRHPRHATA